MACLARTVGIPQCNTGIIRVAPCRGAGLTRWHTPGGELPFAGHPTLGSAHAWLEAGGVPHTQGELLQECGAGLVELRAAETLAFAAPPLVRSGSADPSVVEKIAAGLRIRPDDIIAAEWVDNGPGWVAALLRDADAVLALEPDFAAMAGLEVGAVGKYPTGSLNAGLAQWLIEAGELPPAYIASQGTHLGRRGRVHVDQSGEEVWISGATTTTIVGTVDVLP